MTLPVRFLPEAKEEFDAAADWYEQRQIGLGIDFVTKIREVVRSVAQNPRMHAKVYGDVRKAVVKRFPYLVLYREDATEVIIVSVFHSSRNPGIWKKRA